MEGDPRLLRLRWRRRAAVAILVVLDALIVLLIRSSHRGTHIAESVVFPGAGLFENHPFLTIEFAIALLTATVMWMSWGADWLVGVVWVAGLATTVALAPVKHVIPTGALHVAPESHEFPLVMAVMAVITWVKSVVGRLPGVRQLRRARARARERGAARGDVVDDCRAASIAALAVAAGSGSVDGAAHRRAIESPRIRRRARRVGAVARWRIRGDPLGRDQAHIRTALVLWGELDACAIEAFRDEARQRVAGVPASEAGWVRPLDGALAAAALARFGDDEGWRHWQTFVGERWGLRRGHRPAWWYEPLGLAAGSSPPWEHAAMSAICTAHGWTGDADWRAVRQATLGAAARHDDDAHDERLVAAGRVWMTLLDDQPAANIIRRRSAGRDPIAVALTDLAGALAARPHALRPSADSCVARPIDS